METINLEYKENMRDYVIRKLCQPYFKISQISEITEINIITIYNIRDGKNSLYENIQTLHDFFRKAAD